ncbi:MAG TPA: phosphoadenosine phosphosulfate reductase family protein [Phycisphaerae bacterium]|nr:phosphoadenosine phosphosulfate reductase family protein [Phycisphaerae bacterium]HQL76452.1 phosphoadenosine phosphosulfate reductase family protein [Phycisphaerae bacterium]
MTTTAPPKTMYDGQRISMRESIDITIASLQAHAEKYRHWAIAWSGGKDSTTLLTLAIWLIQSGRVKRPERLIVLYADTRMELPPLAIAAADIIDQLREAGVEVQQVCAPMDHRYFVYMFGRGVPTPGNRFRWCTGRLKIMPMKEAVRQVYQQVGEKLLVLTGVRQGESAMRDGRIAMSCGKDGAECGQGWFQETLPGEPCDTLAPILHWRVCHVWEWLKHWAVQGEFGDWDTAPIADAYGGDEAEELNCRTGCICCPVAGQDKALETIIANPSWSYLRPLLELRPLYEELRLARHRKRKPAGELNAQGQPVKNQCRKGPLIMKARLMGLARVIDIQTRINTTAQRIGRPTIDLINSEEIARIHELIAANTWPDKWSGDEPFGERPMEEICSLPFFEDCVSTSPKSP